MSLWTVTGCIDEIKHRLMMIDKLLMSGNERDIDWDRVKVHAEQIQEMSETLVDDLYELED